MKHAALRFALIVSFVTACGPGVPRGGTVRSLPPTPAIAPCPTSLVGVLPESTRSWLFVRPHAVLTHARLGPLLARSVDTAGEQALVQRAERTGCDVRTLERAAVAWTEHGEVYVGAGALDGARMASLLWERLLGPRRRTIDAQRDERIEGVLVRHPVGLGVRSACGVVAFEEHEDGRVLDRLWRESTAHDPDELLVWHASQAPREAARAAPALMQQVTALDLTVGLASADAGVAVNLRLTGSFHDDAAGRVRAAMRALVESPVGELAGAATWLAPDDATALVATPTQITWRVTASWRALQALADALRGNAGGAIVD